MLLQLLKKALKPRYDNRLIGNEFAGLEPDPNAALIAARANTRHRLERLLVEQRAQANESGLTTALLYSLVSLCFQLDRDEECEQWIHVGLANIPDDPPLLSNLAGLRMTHGQHEQAEEILRHALKGAPTERSLRFSLTMVLMAQGKYPEAHQLFASRLIGPPRLGPKTRSLQRWRGESLQGRSLLLWSDWGGFGDDIAYIRFALAIRERYGPAKIHAAVPGPLVGLFAAQPWLDEVTPLDEPCAADFQCPMIDAYAMMCSAGEALPTWQRYLQAPEKELRFWSAGLANENRLKVGLVWSGSVGQTGDYTSDRLNKHIPAEAMQGLRSWPGVAFVSLQKGGFGGSAARVLPQLEVLDATDELDDFASTAALISQLDLVVAVDTSVAHLAGAIGVPTLVLLKKSGSSYFPAGRQDTPWYPSTRSSWQHVHGDWSEPVRVACEVIQRMARGMSWPACFDDS